MKRLPFVLLISGLTGILLLGALWTTVAQADSQDHFTLEVAMDSALGGVNFPDDVGGIPGRAFVGVFNGNIYPKGTLGKGDNDFDPASEDGIGTWRCHFTGLNDVALGTGSSSSLDFPLTGAVTYYFQLKPTGFDSAESMIMVMGLNSHTADDDDNVSRVLAVVGGTGRFAGAAGEVREELLGRNFTGARNLSFRFRLRDVTDDDDDD